jgi:2-polyprenyl-3-methyl-5-hydroxy-6-metoxy-1,4-benzoquinol methylase
MHYFSDPKTVGIDVPEACTKLRRRWPQRVWLESVDDSFAQCQPTSPVDIVIAADVIEHLLDPNALMSFVAQLSPRKIILSTPDRNLPRLGTHNGPPNNPAHIREWSFVEFEAYVSSWFKVEEHFISCASQATNALYVYREVETHSMRADFRTHECSQSA